MAEIVLVIEGMHCGSCVRRVSQALSATEGIMVGEVRVGAARVTAADPVAGSEAALAAVTSAGFKAQVAQ